MKAMAITTTIKVSESIYVFQRKGIIKSLVSNKCVQLHKMVQGRKDKILARL
jgi:hypothetical protein